MPELRAEHDTQKIVFYRDGSPLLTETQRWRFTDQGSSSHCG